MRAEVAHPQTFLQAGGERFGAAAARWAGMLGVTLGWRPDEFWRATPAEVAGLFARDAAEAPVDLAALMERFPDG